MFLWEFLYVNFIAKDRIMKNTFGEFIKQKRIESNISLRAFSDLIDISPEYLSKIENNLRAAPSKNVIEKIATQLILNDLENETLFELAAESKPYASLALDLVEYIKENEMIYKTLRIAKRYNIKNEEWQEIYEFIISKHM